MTQRDHYLRQDFQYPDKLVCVDKALLGEHQRKNIKDKKTICQKENISKAVCALLNSGGGIALIESYDKNFNHRKDGLGLDLELVLHNLLYESCVNTEFYDISQEGSYLIIFVKTWGIQEKCPKLCTLDTGLYTRSFTSKKIANAMQVMHLIEQKSRGKGKKACFSTAPTNQRCVIKKLLDKEHLCLGEKLELAESNHVEFKDFSTGKFPNRIKEVMKPYFSAFGNTDGGCLIIGVDDKATVKGCGRGTEGSYLKSLIEEDLNSMIFVHLGGCTSGNQFYTLSIKDVKDENKHFGYVIFLEVKPFCCLGFVKDPHSWILDSTDDNCLGKCLQAKQLTASEWVKIVTNQGSEPSLDSQFERLAIKESPPPLAKTVCTKKGLKTIQALQDSLFGSVEDRLTIKPDQLFEDLKEEHPGLEDLLNTILPESGAVLIVSRSWAVDVEQKSNPNVVCDILLLSPNDYPTLYSVFSAEVSEEEFHYSQITAFELKQKLVNIGSYTGKLCVIPKMLYLKANPENSSFSWPVIKYPDTYKLNDLDTVKELLQSLTIVILSFRSMLSDRIGIEYFNLLTIQQYNVLSKNLFNKIFFVHGPPGSGKTIIALEIIKRIKNMDNCSTDEILFICENVPLRDYVRNKKICQAMTRKWFLTKDKVKVKHIVVDEAQNFCTEDGDWYNKANSIIKQSGGIFWVFLDYFQAYHNKGTGLPECNDQNKHILSEVVRSPQSVYNIILEQMKEIASRSNEDFLSEQIKSCGCSHGIDGFYKTSGLPKAEIVKYVSKKCERYLSRGYSQKDIAILFNTKDAVDHYKGRLYNELSRHARKRKVLLRRFRNAEHISRDAILVDSVRRFSGLESPIVFAINPASKFWDGSYNINLFVCAASRATNRLHVIYEK